MGNKFGLFIHWGIYALTGYQEQARGRLGIPRADYRKLMHEFNPVDYNPDEWVDLAWQAGMRYICFTAKHHDGFCLWNTRYTDFNIMNTPYGRDVLKMLADACARRGMLLSLYYSIPDWNHPQAYNPASSHQCPTEPGDQPDTARYRPYVRNQLTELLPGYGPIYTLFWDIPPHIEDPSLNELARRLQPGILINDRGYDPGDFSTPERHVPEGSRFERLTEACQSVGRQSWGYRINEDYFTTGLLKRSIDKIMAMGGSYLLNVGPTGHGRIDGRSAAIIREIGSWYNRVREGLEDTQPAGGKLTDCYSDSRFIAVEKDGALYLHFHQGLDSSGATICPLTRQPRSAVVLNNGQSVTAAVTILPTCWDWQTQRGRPAYLHLFGLPAEELPGEPIVVKITW